MVVLLGTDLYDLKVQILTFLSITVLYLSFKLISFKYYLARLALPCAQNWPLNNNNNSKTAALFLDWLIIIPVL